MELKIPLFKFKFRFSVCSYSFVF
uniref:Uncharacterized protein n=1 Tax=Anguilla anguilla TaxID=7936 RepID=A0A0E9RXE8_ANGAN